MLNEHNEKDYTNTIDQKDDKKLNIQFNIIKQLQGTATSGLSTDEIMKLTRGWLE